MSPHAATTKSILNFLSEFIASGSVRVCTLMCI